MGRRLMQFLGSILAGTLILAGTQASAQAPAAPDGHYGHAFARPLFGTVASVSGSSLVLTTWTGRSVTLETTAATRVLSRRQAGPADLQAGDLVRVIATKAADGALSVRTLSDVPASLAAAPSAAGTAPGSAGPRGTMRRGMGGGLWNGPRGTVVIVGRLTDVSNGAISIALPAGAPLSVAVPSDAHLSRVASLPLSSLTSGTHVIVRTSGGRGPQPGEAAPGAGSRPLTAVAIFVVPAQR